MPSLQVVFSNPLTGKKIKATLAKKRSRKYGARSVRPAQSYLSYRGFS